MKNAFAIATAILLAISAFTLPGKASEPLMIGALKLDTPWTRATPDAARAGGGFMTITNMGSEADRLVTGSSPRAQKVEFHQMTMKDGVMVMREVDGGIEIPAGASVQLKPGGYHVMYMGIDTPFKMGETIPTMLHFEKAGMIEVPFTVEKIGAKMPGMDHGAQSSPDSHEMGKDKHKMAK